MWPEAISSNIQTFYLLVLWLIYDRTFKPKQNAFIFRKEIFWLELFLREERRGEETDRHKSNLLHFIILKIKLLDNSFSMSLLSKYVHSLNEHLKLLCHWKKWLMIGTRINDGHSTLVITWAKLGWYNLQWLQHPRIMWSPFAIFLKLISQSYP